jgi:SAM-dependent methyltransferase
MSENPEDSKFCDATAPIPVDWVAKYSPLISSEGLVLDLACGKGRITRFLLAEGFSVVALDKDVSGLGDISSTQNLEIVQADLEAGANFPLQGREFSGIVVVNYLHRPLFSDLTNALSKGGVLIYQTFMQGNEAYGRPSNPSFLLEENELEDAFGKNLDVIAFEQGFTEHPKPAMIQKLCAVKR